MDWIYIISIVVLALVVIAFFMLHRSERGLSALLRGENQMLRQENEQLRSALQDGEIQHVKDEAEMAILRERVENQAEERVRMQEHFKAQFQNLAHEIFEEKSKKFTEHNSKNIGELLKPLGENIEKFRERIEKESTDRQILEREIKRLYDMSNRVSEEANNLASALRGNSKTQGDWGEMILETLLESSGLQKGIHFLVQENFKTEEGANVRPDVVLVLPDDKRMVIDSKVSLTAYANCVEAGDDIGARDAAMAAHIASVRAHIQELAGKNYHKLSEKSPDFVIMFIPNEPAYLLALQNDPNLWNEAYKKKIILSSPTNLFAILKIVDDLWRRDNQDRYALEIARQGGALYDKFVGFAESFLSVGDALGRTEKAYKTALGQLKEGNGNLVRRAEKLRQLGVKATKRMPEALEPLDDGEDDAEAVGVGGE